MGSLLRCLGTATGVATSLPWAVVPSCYLYRGIATGMSTSSESVHDSTAPLVPAAQQQPLASVGSDLFSQAMRDKAEKGLADLLEQNRIKRSSVPIPSQQQLAISSLAPVDKTDADDEEADEEPVNPLTGERAGYKGKEPTRFGDWEHKGRCTDFS
ncbi:hypothetical protein V8C86DRAFT_2680914 [Haematococcus lacustris]